MLFDQFLFVGSTFGTFITCFALLKLGIRLIPGADQIQVLSDLDSATDIMDPNSILAFILGLVVSVGVLIYISSGSEFFFTLIAAFKISLLNLLLPRLWLIFFLPTEAKPCLDPKVWQDYKLIEKKQISENTAQYRFRLPSDNGILGLPIGQHISVQAEINGKQVMRSYTPVSSDDDRGFFDLLIKVGSCCKPLLRSKFELIILYFIHF